MLSETQKDEAKSALCDLAVRILGLNAKVSTEDPDTISTTDSEGTCDEEDFEKLLDQQDHKARSKRRKLEETAKTPPSVNKGLASFKLDFHAALQQVEQTDRKSKLNVHETTV